jgi:hypothetical protein
LLTPVKAVCRIRPIVLKRWLSQIPFPYDGAILVTSCAISAVTELAVQRAEQTGLILVGFCRPERAEFYSGCQRILLK